MGEHLDFARELARAAATEILPRFRGECATQIKADGSPVTDADRAAETLMRARIAAAWPDHGILGEEHGQERPDATRCWVLDPIDGTVSFLHGVPLFATLVALLEDGEPVLGVANFPALGEMVWAAKGEGCFVDGEPARVRACAALGEAVVCSSGMHGTDVAHPSGREDGAPVARLGALIRRGGAYRGWGDAYGHALVATGRADVMVDPVMSPWDIAALVPILEEAGGTVTSLDGRRENIVHAGSLVSTAGPLHQDVLEILEA